MPKSYILIIYDSNKVYTTTVIFLMDLFGDEKYQKQPFQMMPQMLCQKLNF